MRGRSQKERTMGNEAFECSVKEMFASEEWRKVAAEVGHPLGMKEAKCEILKLSERLKRAK